MVNILLLIGTGHLGEDVLHKLPWAKHLNSEHQIHVVTRIDSDIHLSAAFNCKMGDSYLHEIGSSIAELKSISKDYSLIYSSEFFGKKYKAADVEKIQSWLGISFKYISSFDRRFYDRDTFQDKRPENLINNYAAALVEFYKEYYESNSIDVIINTIEDDLFSVIAYYVAKKMGVHVIGFMNGRFPKKGIMFCEDFKEPYIWNKDTINPESVMSQYTSSTITGVDTMNKNIQFFDFASVKENLKRVNIISNYIKFRKDVCKIYSFEECIYRHNSILNEANSFIQKVVKRSLIKLIIKEPEHDDKYLFFPLHYMDDAQITFREPLIDQYNLIYHISRALPSGYLLYVKPHPHYLGTDISFRKLLKISKLENVKIIIPSLPPISIIKKSQGVITINSTTGFEAMIMSCPVITFGHDFYCKKELTYTIRDMNTLSESISMCLNCGNEKKSCQKFVSQIYNNTIWISSLGDIYPSLTLSSNDGQNIAAALNIILKKYVTSQVAHKL